MNETNKIKVQQLLGYAGLIPFVGIVGWRAVAGGAVEQTAMWLFISYSAVILAFLAGTLWHSTPNDKCFLMILSNVFAVVAWLCLAFVSVNALLFLATSYGLLLIAEYILAKDHASGAYARLRLVLTSVVVTLHLVMFFMFGA